tara:strand:- start:389 stop:685 length:297 start_codon:yes stop_codon:yes gene_type:complete
MANNNHGGARDGAGRPSVKVEDKKNYILSQVMQRLTSEEDEDEAKVNFLMQWCEVDPKGAYKFINEHVHGKPKETNETTLIGGNDSPIIIMKPTKKDE